MNEIETILTAFKNTNDSAVLATVVKVTGSAYRRPGARMLVFEDGSTVGTVSGGCLEADVTMKAVSLLKGGPSQMLVEYDTTREDEVLFGAGLGCGGSTDIFLEFLHPSEAVNSATLLSDCLSSNEPAVIATIISAQGSVADCAGAHWLIGRSDRQCGSLRDEQLQILLIDDGMEALRSHRSKCISYDLENGRAEVFYDFIAPPVPLVIFGAGHDAQPLVALAKQLGWKVTLVDDRPAYVTGQRFPQADSLLLSRLDNVPAQLHLQANTATVVMTHNFSRDLKILKFLLESPVNYIGVLGPKLRTERLIQEIRENGQAITSDRLQCIHAPVGLDVGAETPAEIALSILAEIQSVAANRTGAQLRDREGPIHDRFLSEHCTHKTDLTEFKFSTVPACPQSV